MPYYEIPIEVISQVDASGNPLPDSFRPEGNPLGRGEPINATTYLWFCDEIIAGRTPMTLAQVAAKGTSVAAARLINIGDHLFNVQAWSLGAEHVPGSRDYTADERVRLFSLRKQVRMIR
jgi:hypothetical protein